MIPKRWYGRKQGADNRDRRCSRVSISLWNQPHILVSADQVTTRTDLGRGGKLQQPAIREAKAEKNWGIAALWQAVAKSWEEQAATVCETRFRCAGTAGLYAGRRVRISAQSMRSDVHSLLGVLDCSASHEIERRGHGNCKNAATER
jgi:hypothetical protein